MAACLGVGVGVEASLCPDSRAAPPRMEEAAPVCR